VSDNRRNVKRSKVFSKTYYCTVCKGIVVLHLNKRPKHGVTIHDYCPYCAKKQDLTDDLLKLNKR
jgi:hypothetical protein